MRFTKWLMGVEITIFWLSDTVWWQYLLIQEFSLMSDTGQLWICSCIGWGFLRDRSFKISRRKVFPVRVNVLLNDKSLQTILPIWSLPCKNIGPFRNPLKCLNISIVMCLLWILVFRMATQTYQRKQMADFPRILILPSFPVCPICQ